MFERELHIIAYCIKFRRLLPCVFSSAFHQTRRTGPG